MYDYITMINCKKKFIKIRVGFLKVHVLAMTSYKQGFLWELLGIGKYIV